MFSVLILLCGFSITFSLGTPVNQHASESIDDVTNVSPVRLPLRDIEGNRQPFAIKSLSAELEKKHAVLSDKGPSEAGKVLILV
ncbi:unnamed protein product [Dibothriocephalus latus]|uniref:Uncharacterized protein n=1 Tax=Dibothriocephalus latus TaxID=60516 RepID=A0A3P7N3L0_DIBLA|nr:unnamed protein product [Dibothriocephalus latus]